MVILKRAGMRINIRKRAKIVNVYLMLASARIVLRMKAVWAAHGIPVANEFATKIKLRLCSSPIS